MASNFLTGIVAGVDVAATLGIAARNGLRFFRPATAGVFGSVAAIASMRRMPRETALDAFGLALAFASGTMQAHVEGLPVLPLQIAQAARSAIDAVDFARAGMPGPRAAIEGPFGYIALFENAEEAALEAALDLLQDTHHIVDVSWKPFPTGRAAHGGIVATQRLMADHGVDAANLVELVYRAPPLIHRLVGRRPVADMTPSYARLCFPYLAAVTLRRGTVTLSDFDAAALADSEVLDLAERIRIEVDDNPDPSAFVPAVASARLTDGRSEEAWIEAQLGSPAFPLSTDQHLAKARACLAHGGMESVAEELCQWIATLRSEANVADGLARILQPD